MLVEVTYLVKPPQRVTFKGVPSMIWLKRLNFVEGSIRDTDNLSLESPTPLTVPHFDDRELRTGGDSLETRQSPNGLVQGRSHVVNSISSEEANFGRNIGKLKPCDMPLIFYIVITSEGISLRWRKGIDFRPESLKVYLRPTNLCVGVSHAWHDAKSLAA